MIISISKEEYELFLIWVKLDNQKRLWRINNE